MTSKTTLHLSSSPHASMLEAATDACRIAKMLNVAVTVEHTAALDGELLVFPDWTPEQALTMETLGRAHANQMLIANGQPPRY